MAQQGGTYKVSRGKEAHSHSPQYFPSEPRHSHGNNHITSKDDGKSTSGKCDNREREYTITPEGTGVMARIHSFITSRRRGADRVDEEGWVLVTYPEEEEEQKPTEEKDDRSQDYWRFSTGSSIGIGWGQRKLNLLEWNLNVEKGRTYHKREPTSECEVDDDVRPQDRKGGKGET